MKKNKIIDELCDHYAYTRSMDNYNICYRGTEIHVELDLENNNLIINQATKINLDYIIMFDVASLNVIIRYYNHELDKLITLIDLIKKAGYNKYSCSYHELTLYHSKLFSKTKKYIIDLDNFNVGGIFQSNSIKYKVGNKTISTYNNDNIFTEGVY